MKLHTMLLVGSVLAVVPRPALSEFGFGAPTFTSNSAALDDRSKMILIDAALILRRNPDHKLKLYGSRGQLESDTSISQHRLINAQMFLVENGVSGHRILIEDHGVSAPAQPNCSQAESPEECDKYNRNIQLQLVSP